MNRFDPMSRKRAFDATGVTDTIKRALASAGLDTSSGPFQQVTNTIEDALSAAGLMAGSARGRRGSTIEGSAREVHAIDALAIECVDGPHAGDDPMPAKPPTPQAGVFLERSFVGATGSRAYKVYVPGGHSAESGEPVPLVVMLHGCTQSPDDFAAGTRMNMLADEHGFIVVYPAQCAAANAQKCWNWFRTEDQLRESGEPAIIAGLTREVASRYRVDPRRIFVAGMSAGAAMAVILATTYPDLYAAVGAHSGLAYRAAHDMPSAFSAMHGGGRSMASASGAAIPLPTIVFHGDSDRTVNAGNATAIVRHAVAGHAGSSASEDATSGTAGGGRRFSRKTYVDTQGRVIAEHWIVHGAGHAWSGGSRAGTFTDEAGPDASREMVRFFLALPRAGNA